MYNRIIHERALRVIKERDYIKDCHTANICPKCGHELVGKYTCSTGSDCWVYLDCKNSECNYKHNYYKKK